MKTRQTIPFATLAAFFILATTSVRSTTLVAENRPNIVIIICDDLNDSVAGMGGHPQAKTPNIDRIVEDGVLFMNAASNVPLCGPARASMWSGLLPTTTGYYGYQQQVNHWKRNPVLSNSVTLFELFTENGYRNFATGKIHHNGHEVLEIFENPDGYPGFGTKPNFGPIPNDGKSEHTKHGVLPPWMPEEIRAHGGWGDGFGPIQDLKKYGEGYGWTLFYSGESWEFREGHNRDLMPDEVCAQDAVRFLGEDHDKPFLLTVGFSRPHSPWYAPQEFFDLFPLDGVKLTPILGGDAEDVSRILAVEQDIAQPWGWAKYKKIETNGGDLQLLKWTQAYLACVAFVDHQVGVVLEALESSSYATNTIVIFTGDHGYHMGEKEYLFKYSPWEESVRVPLVISGPGVAKGKVLSQPVSLVDIYPTCADFAGIELQNDVDGHSLKPFLVGSGNWTGRDYSLSAIASKVAVDQNQVARVEDQHFSIRTERFRYIRCRNGEEELYDHEKDPHEWVNQMSNPEYQGVLERMRARYSESVLKLL
ncbi:MAG: sulfatase [Lentimonas sp.]